MLISKPSLKGAFFYLLACFILHTTF